MRFFALALWMVTLGAACGVEVRTYERPGVNIHHLVVGVGNVWVLESDDGVVMVDLAEKGDADEIIQGLSQLGYAPDDVGVAIITHAHMDHGGPVARLQDEGLRVALGGRDVDIAEAGNSPPGTDLIPEAGFVRLIVDTTFPPWTPDVFLDNEAPLDLSVYGVPGRVLPMPGHTAGSVVVVLDTGDAFVGDLVRGDAPWIGGKGNNEGEATTHFFSDDEKNDRDHLDELLGFGVDTFFPGHGPYFSADSLRGWLADRALELGELDERPQ
jgi:hydroxyacylglutathione hydrolase